MTRNVNLWQDPSTENPPIRLLHPPMQLELLDPDPLNGYYHVRTDEFEEGWVWGHTGPTPTPAAGLTGAPTPTAGIIATTSPTPQPPGPAAAIDETSVVPRALAWPAPVKRLSSKALRRYFQRVGDTPRARWPGVLTKEVSRLEAELAVRSLSVYRPVQDGLPWIAVLLYSDAADTAEYKVLVLEPRSSSTRDLFSYADIPQCLYDPPYFWGFAVTKPNGQIAFVFSCTVYETGPEDTFDGQTIWCYEWTGETFRRIELHRGLPPELEDVIAYQSKDGQWHEEGTEKVIPPALARHVAAHMPAPRSEAKPGVVEMRILVERSGKVDDVVVLKSVSEPVDREAVRAVRQWGYKAARLGGNPVAVWLLVRVAYLFWS